MLGNREDDTYRNNVFSLHDLYGHAHPSARTPAPGVMKFKTLVDPSLVIIILYLVFLIHAWE